MKTKPYSVLLLYPGYVAATYGESFYAFVEAEGAQQAVDKARVEAFAGNPALEAAPEDFRPILVIEGHHTSLIQVEGLL
jgi:hypothetical protein